MSENYKYPKRGVFFLSKEDFIKLCKYFNVYSIDELREKLNRSDADSITNRKNVNTNCVYGYYKSFKDDKGLWHKDYSCPVRTNLSNINEKTLKQYCNNCERVIKIKNIRPINTKIEPKKEYRRLTDAEWDEVYSIIVDRLDCRCYLCNAILVEWSDARRHCWDRHPNETKQAIKEVLKNA